MSLKDNKLAKLAVIAIVIILLLGLVGMAGQVKTLKARVMQLTLMVEERDQVILADKVQYTALAARLNQEIKKKGR